MKGNNAEKDSYQDLKRHEMITTRTEKNNNGQQQVWLKGLGGSKTSSNRFMRQTGDNKVGNY